MRKTGLEIWQHRTKTIYWILCGIAIKNRQYDALGA